MKITVIVILNKNGHSQTMSSSKQFVGLLLINIPKKQFVLFR